MARPKGSKNKARTKSDVPGAAGVAGVGHNSKPEPKAELTPDQQRALFLQHKDHYAVALAAKKKADADLKNVCKVAKAEGFTAEQIKAAIAFETPEGEAKETAKLKQILQAAAWVGAPIGTQLAMFDEPDRTPSVDRAFDEGKQAGLQGLVRKPPYSPEVPQHDAWMNGWYEGQKAITPGNQQPTAPESETAR
jgi:ribosome modulation factor